MLNKVFLIILTVLFFSCTSEEEAMPDYYKLYIEIRNDLANYAKKDLKLRVYSFGTNTCYERINAIMLGLTSQKPMSDQQALEKYVTLGKKCILMCNQHEKARPYLYKYPADSEMIEISLNYINQDNHDCTILIKNELVTRFVYIPQPNGDTKVYRTNLPSFEKVARIIEDKNISQLFEGEYNPQFCHLFEKSTYEEPGYFTLIWRMLTAI